MVEKRILTEPESNEDQPISLTSMIRTFAMVTSKDLERVFKPVIRKLVQEEMEKAIRRRSPSVTRTRSSSFRIQALEPSSLQLIFLKPPSLPIFTASKVLDEEGNPLKLLLVEKSTGRVVSSALSRTTRVEIVVLDGDFDKAGKENWSSEEFEESIVKGRTEKRPLIHGDVNIKMKDGMATIEVEFTDNSSRIRCRKFRLGARIFPGSSYQDARILEAVTEPFMVKDHRGELCKHYPPKLGDEVWRLEKIGKNGKFHEKLNGENINTVQDFLKLSTIDLQRLKRILGSRMSDRMWEITLSHARACQMGTKMYIFRGDGFTLFLNPICELVSGQMYSSNGCSFNVPKEYIDESWVRQAYSSWQSLEEVDGL